MTAEVTESQFHVWRALFAVAHADNIVTDEEVKFMAHVMDEIDFSEEQSDMLKDDLHNAKDAESMFSQITEQEDRELFFDLARDLVWVDGDFDEQEQTMMVKLHKMHIKEINVDKLVGNISMEFEEDTPHQENLSAHKHKKSSFFDVIKLFKSRHSNDS